ncbi:hypothetical protein GXP71_09670 [Cellulomonas sp. H30R-01]|uniref:hypothetical protein n=1 Tax=Cellulomonas sp. H30R-01 TaxID=2704467 RepID=UPI00138D772A|nr:hypothetical protein [Cellulomonas sp. H30R-01]QHT56318.1 hypothetical protein GXP71_09670 [Cellulomonas sp. H30R-01]
MIRVVRALVAVLATATALLAASVLTTPAPATAADLSRFDPGFIISDAVFYNAAAMSAPQVQAFLDQKGASCVPAAGSTCLKSYTESTTTRAATNRCAQYTGQPGETAAVIIAKVAAACGINPQVLLVTLQKEQGLVTATTGKPAATYQKAMGYGCPDTAPCDALYYGFFNQVYSAASQFRNYQLNPGSYSHRAGLTNNVRFHPNAACGTAPVLIRNQATAGLYNYTPYQPNAAALAAGYGTGDACSSYGNRNFWNYFSDWFGNPAGSPPFGFLDSVTVAGLNVTATGWAIDPETNAPIAVHVYAGGSAQAFTADLSRPDLVAPFGRGDKHGFVATMPVTPGTQDVCVWAINSDAISGNTLLGCRTVTVPNPLRGFVDAVTPDATGVYVKGWAYDPDAPATSVPVSVTVDGVETVLTADQPRPDVDAAYGSGPRHGFEAHVAASTGRHTVCLTARKPAPGRDLPLTCRDVTVVNQQPTGFLDSVTTTATTVTVAGWALDPDTTDPIAVHMYVDGNAQAFTADLPRADIAAAFGKGDRHGFTATMPASPGTHSVCLYAINTPSGPNVAMGCRTVTITNANPTGFIDAVTGAPGSVTAQGWALDPDTTDPVAIHMYVDGTSSQAFTADQVRTDIGAIFGKGDKHGFTATMPATPGPHTVCLYAINTPAGPNVAMGCRSVTVPAANRAPIGFLDSFTSTASSVTVQGWALDPDTTAPIAVHVYVDGNSQAFTADQSRPDIAAAFGLGDRHGFTATMPATPGPHNVCVYAINTPAGSNVAMGCRTVTVG